MSLSTSVPQEERARKYMAEVQSLQFNVLVTTYEYIMRDRTRLAKVDWKYIVIDEAQRMKDRESKLAKDLDRFRAERRLLLTGTPLQNDLRELWSLLNLLLPEVRRHVRSMKSTLACCRLQTLGLVKKHVRRDRHGAL